MKNQNNKNNIDKLGDALLKFFGNNNTIYASIQKRFLSFLIDICIVLFVFKAIILVIEASGYNFELLNPDVFVIQEEVINQEIEASLVENNLVENNLVENELVENKLDETIVESTDTEISIKGKDFNNSYAIMLIVSALYNVICISSKKQATIGNIVLGIMVIDIRNGKINPLTALSRYVSLMINNSIYFLGYLFYFYREDRAFLQDLLSGTRVININNKK